MKGRLRQIATAGNAVAVALAVMVLANRELLFGPSPSPPAPAPARSAPGRPVLLVVIDALRSDRAEDPSVMPHLARLGRVRTARVESWIPSTVAGIRSIVEGAVPPPASFFHDFAAPRSPDGGIFAAAQAAGLRTFAAGPRLWNDLYGPWLDGSASTPAVGGDDGEVVRAAWAALSDHDLVAVHLSGPDDAAHLHGGDSREYRRALRRADAALGRLLARAGPGRAVVVTSDHGVTHRGGHAGPEPEVVKVPVVVRGAALDGLREIRQRDLGRLVLGTGRSGPPPWPPSPGGPGTLLAPLFGLVCICLLARRLARGGEGGNAAFLLDATLWTALLLAILGLPQVALGITVAALATAPFLIPLPPRPGQEQGRGGEGLALAAGVAGGALRLLDGGFPAGSLLPPGIPGLLAVGALGLGLGLLLRRLLARHPLAAGVLAALLPAVLLRLLGETASLSTLDVRLAFRVALGPLGLPGAVAAVLLAQALPVLVLLLGLVPALARCPPDAAGRFAAGLALVLVAEGAFAAAALHVEGPLALGLLVRLFGETTFLFLGSAAAVALPGITPRGARSRTPAATPP